MKTTCKKTKIMSDKACFQRGFKFFQNISFIKEKLDHQKLKAAQKI